ncbi:phage head spike fiber domain-containing protein [Flectobacillus major]|uniref:phage head spike fiber domain-containing protein n=1 Tax=Flectobacillus major TaxID=103 RepID=UPI0004162898|nr:hypothetical protein [Flectobacillus major]
MAQILKVKPEYVNKVQVHVNGKLTLLNNDLTQEQLLAFFLKAEFREYIDITYTNIADSFPESFEIDPNLFHAYDSGEVTHDPAKTNYTANTVGKHLNETRGKIDAFDGAFVRPSTRPSFFLDFSNSRFIDPKIAFYRNSPATYIDKNGVMREAKANQPRFTHDPLTLECLGFLPEEFRQNLIPNSMNIDLWDKNNAIYNGPSKLLGWPSHSFTLTSDISSFVRTSIAVVPGTTYTYHYLSSLNTASAIRLSSSNRSIAATTEFLTNGVWLHSFRFTPVAGETSVALYIGKIDANGSAFNVTAPQLEIGLDYTSFIPTTNGVKAREKDVCGLLGTAFSDFFPSLKKGTIVVAARRSKAVWGQYISLSGPTTSNGINLIEAVSNSGANVAFASFAVKVDGTSVANANSQALPNDFIMGLAFDTNNTIGAIDGTLGARDIQCEIPFFDKIYFGGVTPPNTPIKYIAIWNTLLTDNELINVTKKGIAGRQSSGLPSNSDLGSGAYVSPYAIMRSKTRQEFSVDCSGANVTRNVRRDYDFTFEIVDSSGCTIVAQPASSCTAGTDNPLTFSGPVGKTLTYAITPIYEY